MGAVNENDYVFTQGDAGREFFVIIEGSAEAVREEAGGEERILKEYARLEYFGERALLRSEPRYASVRATSKLHTAKISQASFEEVMGVPLSALLTETYQVD